MGWLSGLWKGVKAVAKPLLKGAVAGLSGGVASGVESGVGNVINHYISPPANQNTPNFNATGYGAQLAQTDIAANAQRSEAAGQGAALEGQREALLYDKYKFDRRMDLQEQQNRFNMISQNLKDEIAVQRLTADKIQNERAYKLLMQDRGNRSKAAYNRLGEWFFGQKNYNDMVDR